MLCSQSPTLCALQPGESVGGGQGRVVAPQTDCRHATPGGPCTRHRSPSTMRWCLACNAGGSPELCIALVLKLLQETLLEDLQVRHVSDCHSSLKSRSPVRVGGAGRSAASLHRSKQAMVVCHVFKVRIHYVGTTSENRSACQHCNQGSPVFERESRPGKPTPGRFGRVPTRSTTPGYPSQRNAFL